MADQKLPPSCARSKIEIPPKRGPIKRAAIYTRVSCGDQHPETQLYDLRELAKQRQYEIVKEYSDVISGAKSKRPGLDQLVADARRHRFDIVLVAAFDRIARNVRHFLEVLDELNHLGIEFVSLRENIDTGGPLGRAMVVIVGAIAELERSLIVERVKAGMRRARLEGRRIGRAPLNVDRAAIVRDRLAWIIHDFTDEKRKDALKGVMNTGFWRTRHSLSEHPRNDISLYTTADLFLLPTPTYSS